MNPELTPVIGDRVKLINTNGDEATVTLREVTPHGVGTARNFFAFGDDWAVVKILPRPLPTEPGIYGPRGKDGFGPYKLLVLTKHGEWFWLDITARPKSTVFQALPADEVEEWADTIEPIAVRNK